MMPYEKTKIHFVDEYTVWQPKKKFTGHGRRMVDNFVDNGSTAIHLLDNSPFGVVVADMQMP